MIAPPIKVIAELSKKLKNIDIGHVFCHDIRGLDVGAIVYRNGIASFKAFYKNRTIESKMISDALLSSGNKRTQIPTDTPVKRRYKERVL